MRSGLAAVNHPQEAGVDAVDVLAGVGQWLPPQGCQASGPTTGCGCGGSRNPPADRRSCRGLIPECGESGRVHERLRFPPCSAMTGTAANSKADLAATKRARQKPPDAGLLHANHRIQPAHDGVAVECGPVRAKAARPVSGRPQVSHRPVPARRQV
jgi:hypothetical protein